MSEIQSSQRRPMAAQRDSSVTQVRIEPSKISSTASRADDQATVISSRPPGSGSSAPPLLAPLEVGKLLEGERLGQFELRRFVGGGGMGVVFRAWDTTLNREVAVKVLSRDQSADEETLRRFRNEAQSAARLDHGNIARVHYVGEDRGVHYIVFEFIEGVNLRDLVDRHGPLPVDEAIDYTLQVAEALDHASQRDVIHRDIKPSNVLITAEGIAKVVDMGLARLHQVEPTDNDLTASGVTLGTFDYISPEQARDPRSADVRSDLYSLGCSLYFMLVGQPPFPQGTVLQKLLQHQGEEVADPRTLRPDLPSDLVKVVHKLLAKSPTQRYQRPANLIDELHTLRERLQTPGRLVGQSTWMQRAGVASFLGWKHLPWALPIVVLLVISLGLDYYWSQADRAAEPVAQAFQFDKRHEADSALHQAGRPDLRHADLALPEVEIAPAQHPPANPAESVQPSEAEDADEKSSEISNDIAQPSVNRLTEGVIVVGDLGSGASFATLEAACRAAKNGDVIELQYDGRREEAPFAIANTKLTIRAGEGFAPVVRFAPGQADQSARSMITISGGSVSLINVAVEFVVPHEVAADRWTLLELRRPELLRLERSSLTIRNATPEGGTFHSNVAFVVVAAGARSEPEESDGETATTKAVSAQVAIELHNCVVRGEATLLKVGEGESTRLMWDNGLLITSDRLLVASGSSMKRRPARVELEARHLTAVVRSGLAWLEFSESGMGGLLADLRLSGSIVRVGSSAPLVEQLGPTTSVDTEGPLNWSGDRNFYEGVNVFWRRNGVMAPDSDQELTFDEWQAFWGQSRETLPYLDAVVWRQLPVQDLPVSEQSLADYALSSASANNPARDSASDGLNAGCLLDQLPLLPQP